MAAGRLRGHPFIRLSFIPRKAERLLIAPQDLRTADGTRASEIYAGRFAFAGKVVISDGRSPFEIAPPSDEWAASAARLRLAAPSARRRSPASPAPTRARWSTNGSRCRARGIRSAWQPEILARRITSWLSQAPLILHDADDAVLPPLPAQPGAPGPLPAPHRDRGARRRAADAGAGRADLCGALHVRPGAAHAQRRQAARRRDRPPDPARRRPHQPQPGRADRTAARSPAAAPCLRGAQHRAAAAAQQRHRPHDADDALLPARRRQLRAFQRHGPDAARRDGDHPGL